MILFLFGALLGTARAADYNYLVFTLTDGSQTAVVATGITMSVSGTNLVVTSSAKETLATLALSSLAKMEFSNDGSATGISTISANTLKLDESTVVYDLNGRQLPYSTQLPKGVYILKTNGRTVKVQIR